MNNNRITEIDNLLTALNTRIEALEREKEKLIAEEEQKQAEQLAFENRLDVVIAAYNLVVTDKNAGNADKPIPYIEGMFVQEGKYYLDDGNIRCAVADGVFESGGAFGD